MRVKKISARAILLLRMLAEQTKQDTTGKLLSYAYIPSGGKDVWVEFDDRGKSLAPGGRMLYVTGGDYRSLRTLVDRGLATHPSGGDCSVECFYSITDTGREYLRALDTK